MPTPDFKKLIDNLRHHAFCAGNRSGRNAGAQERMEQRKADVAQRELEEAIKGILIDHAVLNHQATRMVKKVLKQRDGGSLEGAERDNEGTYTTRTPPRHG